jgi:hypothetical protein
MNDLERTRELCRKTLAEVGPEILSEYAVVRDSREVLVPRADLSPEELTVIIETVKVMGAEALREAEELECETVYLEPFFKDEHSTGVDALKGIKKMLEAKISHYWHSSDALSNELLIVDEIMSEYYRATEPRFLPTIRAQYRNLLRSRLAQ